MIELEREREGVESASLAIDGDVKAGRRERAEGSKRKRERRVLARQGRKAFVE